MATFEENGKFERLKQFLQHHVVENIRKSRFVCSYEVMLLLEGVEAGVCCGPCNPSKWEAEF